jgi:hypothetical protein
LSHNIILPNGGGSLWVPGMGEVPTHLRQSMKAVEEYDADLRLARNEDTGHWCIFIERGSGDSPFPVFNLGPELPGPDQIKVQLYRADVRRRGHEILRDVERNNQRQRDALQAATDEAAGDAAESIEFAMRKMHATSHKKVYLNERVKK